MPSLEVGELPPETRVLEEPHRLRPNELGTILLTSDVDNDATNWEEIVFAELGSKQLLKTGKFYDLVGNYKTGYGIAKNMGSVSDNRPWIKVICNNGREVILRSLQAEPENDLGWEINDLIYETDIDLDPDYRRRLLDVIVRRAEEFSWVLETMRIEYVRITAAGKGSFDWDLVRVARHRPT